MISIVIPLYNKAHTIVHTLNAVFKQEYQDFEVYIDSPLAVEATGIFHKNVAECFDNNKTIANKSIIKQ